MKQFNSLMKEGKYRDAEMAVGASPSRDLRTQLRPDPFGAFSRIQVATSRRDRAFTESCFSLCGSVR